MNNLGLDRQALLRERLLKLRQLEALRRQKSTLDSLYDFFVQAWQVIEPGKAFVDNWHIHAIAEHLEAVTAREIQRLIVNVPPRTSKSSLVSVCWPAWVWLHEPAHQWLTLSHAEKLSIRDNLKCRRLIKSVWYQDLARMVGADIEVMPDQDNKMRFDLATNGARIMAGFTSGVTGDGGDTIVIDDPHDAKRAQSDVERTNVLRTFDESLSTRLNDPETGAIVIIMQRLHAEDLSGHLLGRFDKEAGCHINDLIHGGDWEHLMIPMEFEPERKCHTSIGWEDPRREAGALMWPERISKKALERLKGTLGPYAASGQLQQRPTPEEGVYFKRDWFNWYNFEDPPVRDTLKIYGASDYATKEDEGDYTVHGVIGVDPEDNIYVLDWWYAQTTSDAWIETLLDLAKRWKPLAWAEEKGQILRSLGPFIAKRMQERKVYFYRTQFASSADKATRARAIQARIAQGKIFLPYNAPWTDRLVNLMTQFPMGAVDDDVDVMSLFGRMLDTMIPGRERQGGETEIRSLGDMSWDELIEREKHINRPTSRRL